MAANGQRYASPDASICEARASACVSIYSRIFVTLPFRTVMAKTHRWRAKRAGNILVTPDLLIRLRNWLTSVDRQLPILLSGATYFSRTSAVNSGVVLLGL